MIKFCTDLRYFTLLYFNLVVHCLVIRPWL